jgi:hypothetical protein
MLVVHGHDCMTSVLTAIGEAKARHGLLPAE